MQSQVVAATYFSSRRRRRAILQVFLVLIAIVAGATFLFPFFWTVTSSFKTPAEVSAFPPVWIPRSPRFANYREVFERTFLTLWIANTSYITVLALMGSILSSAIAGYSFARFEYRGRDLLFFVTLGTMMLPAQVTLISRYLLFHRLGWINTFKPLWIPAWFGGGAFSIFLMRQFILSLPRELDEAALIDGASYVRVFWALIVPLCKPVLATAAVIGFIAHWNNYMDPLIYLHDRKKMVLAVGIDTMKQDSATMGANPGEPTFHLLMALCTLAIIPCVILFFSAQRYFVRGIVLSGIKG
jgi:ABC-type glycerol-3-phosphate transport system permease component